MVETNGTLNNVTDIYNQMGCFDKLEIVFPSQCVLLENGLVVFRHRHRQLHILPKMYRLGR